MTKVYEEEKKYLDAINELIEEEIKSKTLQHQELARTKLSFEDRKRGEHFRNNAMLDLLHTRIKKLESIILSPYFGRMDFTDSELNELHKLYIGKATLTDKNKNSEIAVIDWRSPISSMYYDNSIGKASYIAPQGTIEGDITLKRQIIIENQKLQKVIEADLVGRDEILQEYLNVHADSKMKNIVASIQQEQNKVIRQDFHNDIIVQGIAGSGKTSVALHRIAYLIYLLNNDINKTKNINTGQFMIIGPNSYFLDYISSVLPDLDVASANQLTLTDLVSHLVNEKIRFVDQSKELQEYLKNGEVSLESKIKSSSEFEIALNKYTDDLYNYYTNTDIQHNGITIFDKEYVKSSLAVSNVKLSDKAKELERHLITRVKKDVKDGYGKFENLLTKDIKAKIQSLPQGSEARNIFFNELSEIREDLKNGLQKTIKSHFSIANKSIVQHYANFITNIDGYMNFEEIDDFKAETLKSLSKKTLSRSDIAPILLLKEKLSSTNEYKDTVHIVIDEAQDFGILEFRALKELFPQASFSIFGDLNQSIFAYKSVKDWEMVKDKIFNEECEIFELNQSYRTTDEIMKEANKISDFLTGNVSKDIVRHGEPVRYTQLSTEEVTESIGNQVINYLEKGYTSIGIITKTEQESKKINKELNNSGMNIGNITFDDKKYNGGVCTMASNLSKGLEFDATILVNVDEDNYDVNNDIDMKLLYVSMTRALHETNVIYTKKLPSVLKNASKPKALTKSLQ